MRAGRMALVLSAALAAAPAAARECAVTAVEGQGARLFDGRVWRALDPAAPPALPKGVRAKLRTGAGDRVEIGCDDGVVVTVGPGSEVDLDGLAGPSGPAESVALWLARGLIGVVAPVRDWFRFEVRTPLAIASVRSTDWAVSHGPKGSAVFVVDGAVAVLHRDGADTLRPGEGLDVGPDGAPGGVVRWGEARVAALRAALGFGWR